MDNTSFQVRAGVTDWGVVSIEWLFKAGDSTESPGRGYENREEEPGKWLSKEENQEKVSPKPKEESIAKRDDQL